MREHYGFSEEQYNKLLSKGVTVEELFHSVKDFEAANAPVSKISLMHYADKHGDFTELRNKKDLIANEVFENLEIQEKIEVGEYLDWLENGEDEEPKDMKSDKLTGMFS